MSHYLPIESLPRAGECYHRRHVPSTGLQTSEVLETSEVSVESHWEGCVSEQTTLGRIEVSPTAIASIAARTVTQAYGVVGLASKNLADGIVRTLSGDPHRGVSVMIDGDRIQIDLYVIVEYGTRIASVAASLQNIVRFNVEKALGAPIDAVNVHVQGLRVSSTDA